MTESHQFPLDADYMDAYVSLFGLNDQNIALIEEECGVTVALRDHELLLSGDREQVKLA